jgi:hypothetical protein
MKNIAMIVLVTLLLAALAGLGVFARRQTIALREQRGMVQQLNAKLDVVAKGANLDLQQRCAEQALKTWKTGGWEKLKNATYSNHYNAQMNKCFMRIDNSLDDKSGATFTSDRIIDANEGKVYGELTWKLEESGNAMRCKATIPTGEEVNCTSPEEFDQLASAYMN